MEPPPDSQLLGWIKGGGLLLLVVLAFMGERTEMGSSVLVLNPHKTVEGRRPEEELFPACFLGAKLCPPRCPIELS